jgi:hypothetical protein
VTGTLIAPVISWSLLARPTRARRETADHGLVYRAGDPTPRRRNGAGHRANRGIPNRKDEFDADCHPVGSKVARHRRGFVDSTGWPALGNDGDCGGGCGHAGV